MPDNVHQHSTTMATFDNPSYFTISGQSPTEESIGAKPKRFKSWFKLPKIRPKPSPPQQPIATHTEFAQNDVVYYNFTSTTTPAEEIINDDDDVFSDTSTIREIGSTKTLGHRRHSLGSWFRSSLAAVRKQNNNIGSSTASGLESHERPSTSSERGLLARNVSTSTNCVASSANKKNRAAVELRARARYARDSKAVSTSRIPRTRTASLDRRYTKSTEVLASEQQSAVEEQQQEDLQQQREDTRRKSVSSTTQNRQRFVQRSRTIEDRHRTSCCGRMAAAAATGSSRNERRRASFDAASPSHVRKCQKCRDKAEPVGSENVDVVIIFSKHCVVAYQWITYLTEILSKMFSSTNDRPPTRVTSRDVESLIDCSTLTASGRQHLPPTPPNSRFQRTEYQNVVATEQLDAERSARQHAVRKTVATSSLQIVLLSKALLHHVSLHANDPLGTLLNPKRVLGLVLGIDQEVDITPLHRSALITYEYWPKITMLDQNMESVNEFGKLAQSILCKSQPVALVEATAQPARFKITPKKLRSGEERVSLILLETVENIQRLATVHIGIDANKELIRIDKICWVNPYVVTFYVPKMFLERGIIVKVHLKISNTSWGIRELKCQSKLGEISILLSKCQLMASPTEIMCQALNISPVDCGALDKALTASLDKSQISVSAFNFSDPDDQHREEEFPTLLHFAARFGFKDMMWALLECLGAVQALQVRNFHGFTPLQLAEIHGHKDVTNVLNSFIQVIEADKLEASEKSAIADQPITDEYVVMNRSIQERPDYDFLPKPKPVGCVALENMSSTDDDLKYGYVVVLPDSKKKKKQTEEVQKPCDTGSANPTNKHKTAGFVQEAVWRDQSSSEKATLAPAGLLTVSRGSSPLSNWSSSDRSSVTSHASHDSGTHFESSEERKTNHLANDYNVPPPTTRFMVTNYDILPPPVPYKKTEENKHQTASLHRTGALSPRSSPRPPTKFRDSFETIELVPPTSQAILGEDLGRIVPIEEPEFMEQRPIQQCCTQLSEETSESDYIVMTPSSSKRGLPATNGTIREGIPQQPAVNPGAGDYLTTEELNMPDSNFSPKPYSKMMSNSEYQLPANNQEAQMSSWHSDTSLARPIPFPRNRDGGNVTPPVPPRTAKPVRPTKSTKR